MDLLSSLVQQKKKDIAELKKDGKSWISQKDIKEKERQEALKATAKTEAKRKQQELNRLKELESFLSSGNNKRSTSEKESQEAKVGDKKKQKIEQHEDEKPLVPKDEVILRLRKKGQIVTYFGESDWKRYKRLCELEIAEHGDELAGGQQNLFLRLLENEDSSRRGRRRISDAERLEYDEDFDDDENHLKESDQNDVSNKEKTKEVHVRSWIRRMLNEWEQELQKKPEEERVSSLGKIKIVQCKQTRKDLRPLMKKLKHRQLDKTILDKIDDMVTLCEAKEYKAAHDKYIELSIGNAAWPMGVTMVGIHERAGRSKIFTSEIAHILNDETTRKYIHMFKRLISFCQRVYPIDPSKMVSISSTHI